ncbi:hypothetical protein TRVL_02624 [Trypanosoma vivax]|nr:hypothetical protein TRVL_02624 [Trypanosoma vivax]
MSGTPSLGCDAAEGGRRGSNCTSPADSMACTHGLSSDGPLAPAGTLLESFSTIRSSFGHLGLLPWSGAAGRQECRQRGAGRSRATENHLTGSGAVVATAPQLLYAGRKIYREEAREATLQPLNIFCDPSVTQGCAYLKGKGGKSRQMYLAMMRGNGPLW